jgi:hypothetical protein
VSFVDAVVAVGGIPDPSDKREAKKSYAERLARALAQEVAAGLRALGFEGVRPVAGGPGEKEFQGGLGPKKVDVSYADERHGLQLAVSMKSITSPPFGKNLKNRFYDLCPEAITLHMRFPYAVVCALFCFPVAATEDKTPQRKVSTFDRARKLLASISGREEYTDPGEKFDNVSLMLFQPVTAGGPAPWVKLTDTISGREMAETEYLQMLRELHNKRNPHAPVGEEDIAGGEE